MRQKLIFIFVVLVCYLSSTAQSSPDEHILHALKRSIPDSSRVRLLLQLGTWYLLKPGELKSDLDSALLLAGQAEGLSEKIHNGSGVDDARYLIGWVHVEAQRYEQAAALLSGLSDSNRLKLVGTMMRYFTDSPGHTGKDAKWFLGLSQQLTSDAQRNASSYWEAWGRLYQGACYYLLKDLPRGRSSFRQGWELIRRGRHINEEFQYLQSSAVWTAKDTGMDADAHRAFRTALQDAISQLHRGAPNGILRDAIMSFIGAVNQFDREGRSDLAIDAAQQVVLLDKALELHDPMPLSMLCGLATKSGNLKEALRYALEAVQLTESGPMPPSSGFGYSSAGKVYFLLNDLSRSLDYYLKAIAIAYRNPDNSSTPNHNLIRIITTDYFRLGRPAEALAFLDTAEKKLPAQNALEQRIVDDGKADCYFALRRYDLAKKFYLLGLKDARESRMFELEDFLSLAEVSFATGQYRAAIGYLTAITADSNRAHVNYTTRKAALFLLYRTDSALGNFRDAAASFLRHQRLMDSVFNDSTSRRLQEMTVKYESEKKDRNIARLNSNALLRETEEAKIHTIRNALIVISILLLLLAGLLFNRYRLRQRAHRALQQMNASQYDLIIEKEWLMREIHQQVKNNLELVINLTNIQAASLKDELTRGAFEEIRNRVQAISLIHQRLYQEQATAGEASINMKEYIAELVHFLQDGIATGQRIAFRADLDSVDLDVSQSVSVGLILNEAVTNAVKYAFPENGSGHQAELPAIDVELKQLGDDSVRLVIADNGVGLPAGFHADRTDSMGFQLIRNLSLQLNGFLSLANRPGLAIVVDFPRVSTITPPAPATRSGR